MILIILSLLALVLVGRVALGAWRLWSMLPKCNAGFGLVDADTWGSP